MVLRMQNTRRASSLLAVALAGTNAGGQTVTPVSYVGFPTEGQGTVRIGKSQVPTSQEYVLVDFTAQPWPVLQRSVDGSPLVAHGTTHEVATYVSETSLAGLVGVSVDGTLIANATDFDYDGDKFDLTANPDGSVSVGLTPQATPIVGNDSIWQATGDLAAATGPNAAVRVAVGTDGQILVADSGQAAGVGWQDPAAGAAFGTITGPTAIGQAAVDGASGDVADADHQHAFAAPGASYPQAVAAAAVDGVATTPALSDHVHAHGTGYLPDAHHARSHDHSNASDGTALVPASLNVTGGPLKYTGIISPSQITGNQNNYNPTGLATAVVLRLSSDATRTITGLAGGADGRELILVNIGSQNIVLSDENASSTDVNRFALDTSLTLTGDTAARLLYDNTTQRWRLTAIGKATGGGSGNVATDTIWVAKGDLAVATGSGAAARQSVGSNGQFLKANSAQSTGTEWANIAESDVTNLTSDLAAKAPLASPTFTGTATAPTFAATTALKLTDQASAPANAAGVSFVYSKTDECLYFLDADGNETNLLNFVNPHGINSTTHTHGGSTTSGDVTLDINDDRYLIDASGANRTVTLPALTSDADFRLYVIVKTDSSANTVTLSRSSTDTINGATTFVLDTQYEAVAIQADNGTGTWRIVAHYDPAGGGGGMTDFDVAGDGGTPQTVGDGETLTIAGGVGLASTAGATRTVTVDLDINSLTADGSPDSAADYVATYDASAGTHKKVLLNNLPGGGGGAPTTATYVTETSDGTLSAEVLLSTVNETAAYASLTAATRDGRLKFPTDAFVLLRDSGAALVPWGPLFPLTTPITTGWSWDNQGSATISTASGGLYLAHAAGASTNSIKVRYRTAPVSTPWTATFCMIPFLNQVEGAARVGVGFRQSSDGKLAVAMLQSAAGVYNLFSYKWTNSTTTSAQYKTNQWTTSPPLFWQISDDGTNRIIRYGWDGQNFLTYHSVGRTDFLTADQLCFFVEPSTNYNVGLQVISYKET